MAGRKPTEKLLVKADGSPWQQSEQKRPMDAACETAGVEGVTFHILRHTFASHAVMAGMTIEVLAKQLGHKDIPESRLAIMPAFAQHSRLKL